jgi:uncharacterized membrane protein
MSALRELHPLTGERHFRWRGGNPTRVEALSDMVFAFALTLLVVSNQPPGSFAELQAQLWGFPGFAAAFVMLLVLWHAHYIFFRRYGLADGWTTALNAALLFLILFFVYPLKYLATMLSRFVESAASGAIAAPMSVDEAQQALVLLSAAYAAVFLVFSAFYAHARRHADRLDLNRDERAISRFSYFEQLVHVGVAGSVAIVASLAPTAWAPWTGFLYFLIGPLIGILGATMLPKHPRARTVSSETEQSPG